MNIIINQFSIKGYIDEGTDFKRDSLASFSRQFRLNSELWSYRFSRNSKFMTFPHCIATKGHTDAQV